MAGAPFGFAPAHGGFAPDHGGPYSGLRRSVIDPETGRALVTSEPTGEVVQRSALLPVGRDDGGRLVPAVPGLAMQAVEAARFPGQVYRGEASIFDPQTGHVSDEAVRKGFDLAGTALTGSLPFKAPAGALRTFGGGEADDLFASLESALSQGAKNAEPPPPGPSRVDPGAKSWDLFHGSQAGPDFKRFEPQANSNSAERGAIFFGADPDIGNFYANSMDAGAEAGPRVFRTQVDPGKTGVFDLRDLIERDPTFNAEARAVIAGQDPKHGGALFDDYMGRFEASAASDRDVAAQLREMGLQPGERTGVSFGYGHIPAAIERARAQGLDTAILRGLAEHGGGDQVVVLTPNRVRSHYSGDLLYGAAPVGLAGAALASPDAAQAAPSQGNPPVSASPLGLGAAAMRPEDLARLFGRAPVAAGEPEAPVLPARPAGLGFGAAPMPSIISPADLAPGRMPGSVPVAMDEAETQALERATGMVPPAAAPRAPYGFPQRSASAPSAPPGSVRVPLPPARPPEFGSARADAPAEGARPIMAAPAQPANEGPGFLDDLMGGIRKTDGLLTSLGIGLMTQRGFAPSVAAGLQHHQTAQRSRAETDLAQAELALKHRKLAQETGTLQGNAGIIKRAYPGLSDAEALSAGSNGSLVTEALKILRDPNHGRESDPSVIRARAQAQAEGTAAGQPQDIYGTETDASGNTWSVNRRTGKREVALQAREDKAVAMVPEEERARLGLPAGAYQRDANGRVSPVNPTGTTINMGAEKAQDAEIGKSYGKQFVDYQTAGRNAGSKLNTLALMEQAMNMPGFYSGVGGEGVKRAQQFMGALGLKDAKASSGAEVFDALSNKVVLDGLGGSLGPGISNTDRDYISRTAPTLSRSQDSNKSLIGIARKLAEREQVVARLARDYATRNGGRLDTGFDAELDRYSKANPLFPQANDGAKAGAPQDRRSVGGRNFTRGPDNHWYED